jgi:hypothetical protein
MTTSRTPGTPPVPHARRGEPDVGELANKVREVTGGGAVHPDEVAQALEAVGVTDRTARGYGHADLFSLAAEVLRHDRGAAGVPKHALPPMYPEWRTLLGYRLFAARALAIGSAVGAAALAAHWLPGAGSAGSAAVAGWPVLSAWVLQVLVALLVAVPVGELLVLGHDARARWVFAACHDAWVLRRRLTRAGWGVLAVLVPAPLVAAALAGAGNLPWAGLVLLAGGYPLLLLLALRRRLVVAAVLAVLTGAAIAACTWAAGRGWFGTSPPHELTGALLAAGYLIGLSITAHAVGDPERYEA